MTSWEKIDERTVDGFTIVTSVAPEDSDPRDSFDIDADEIFRKIEAGIYVWFVAKVAAFKNGVELASDFLGGCCYESAQAFISEDGYHPDMIAEAIRGAKAKLAELCAA